MGVQLLNPTNQSAMADSGDVCWSVRPSKIGWLSCDGSTISSAAGFGLLRSDSYRELFEIVKTMPPNTGLENFDAGDAIHLPDIQGRVMVGSGSGDGLSPRTLGQTGGDEQVTLDIDSLPAHGHTVVTGGSIGGAITGVTALSNYSTTGTISTSLAGNDGAHKNMQPFLVLNCFIKI